MMKYNDFYNRTGFYYGEAPSPSLQKYLLKYNVLPCLAVDIGAGEGRNSYFLAEKGYSVVAIEPNYYGTKKIMDYAQHKGLQIRIINNDFFNGIKDCWNVGLFIAATVLDHLTKEEIIRAKTEIYHRLIPGGYLFASVFTEDDPGFLMRDPSIISECGSTVQYYFKKNELRELFSELQTLEFKEVYFKDVTHGSPHFHSVAILFAKKPD